MQENDRSLEDIATEFGSLIIAEVAPDEVPDYSTIVREYRNTSSRSVSADHPLAFGAGEFVQMASPYAYEAAKVTLIFLVAQLGISAKEVATETIKAAADKIASKLKMAIANAGNSQSVILTSEQQKTLEARITDRLNALKADPEMSSTVVKSVMEMLSAERT